MWSWKRRCVAVAAAFAVLAASAGTAAAATPIDVQRHWSGTAVNTLLSNNVLGGRANGRYQPDQPVTREEVASILYNLIVAKGLEMEASEVAGTNGEETVPGWFKPPQKVEEEKPNREPDGGAAGKSTGQDHGGSQNEGETPEKNDGGQEAGEEENQDGIDEGEEEAAGGQPSDGAVLGEGGAEEAASGSLSFAGGNGADSGGLHAADANGRGADVEGGAPQPARQPQEISFGDISDERWSFPGITYLAQYGIVSGYPNGTFRPEETLTRKDFAVIVDRYRDYVAEIQGGADRSLLLLNAQAGGNAGGLFTDVGNSYAREAIERLSIEGILSGYHDGSFRPDSVVTRGEAAAVIYSIAGFAAVPPELTLPAKNVIDVPYISQVYPVSAPVGCEATALLMGLKGKGYAQDVDLRAFLDAMPKTASNPAKGFVGSPYVADKTKSTRTTIYPPKLAEFASAYGKVTDFSGASLQELQAELLAGNPVVVYVTLWWEKPFYRYYNIEGERQYLLSNNHAVLVDGYDSETHSYHIADPYNLRNTSQEYRYWISGATFDPLYEERRHALLVE